VNAGMSDSFGIVQLSGKPGGKRKHYKVSVKGLGARRQQHSVFFVSPRVLMMERETHME